MYLNAQSNGVFLRNKAYRTTRYLFSLFILTGIKEVIIHTVRVTNPVFAGESVHYNVSPGITGSHIIRRFSVSNCLVPFCYGFSRLSRAMNFPEKKRKLKKFK